MRNQIFVDLLRNVSAPEKISSTAEHELELKEVQTGVDNIKLKKREIESEKKRRWFYHFGRGR